MIDIFLEEKFLGLIRKRARGIVVLDRNHAIGTDIIFDIYRARFRVRYNVTDGGVIVRRVMHVCNISKAGYAMPVGNKAPVFTRSFPKEKLGVFINSDSLYQALMDRKNQTMSERRNKEAENYFVNLIDSLTDTNPFSIKICDKVRVVRKPRHRLHKRIGPCPVVECRETWASSYVVSQIFNRGFLSDGYIGTKYYTLTACTDLDGHLYLFTQDLLEKVGD